jgi:phosphoglycolate phosphatase-like HAD superfamily hydrolase
VDETQRPVLALDFDGVISDSAPESFAVALQTYADLRPQSALAHLATVPPEDSTRRDLYRRFLRLMPLGNRAEDYFVALDAIEGNAAIEDQAAYDAAYASHDHELLLAFHKRLYELRDAWREGDPKGWCLLMSPYPGFPELLRRLRDRVVLSIATAKDRPSVLLLLESYGLGDLFEDRFLCDKSLGRDKAAHLRLLAERSGRSFGEITFVDDKLNHLEAVAPLGVRCVLAAWGYNGTREARRALAQGFTVATLDGAEEALAGAVGR